MRRAIYQAIAFGLVAIIAFIAGRTMRPPRVDHTLIPTVDEAKLLATTRSVHLYRVPFDRACGELSKTYGVSVNANWAALEAAGIDKETPVTLNVVGANMRQALRLLIGDPDRSFAFNALDLVVGENHVTITTAEDAARDVVTRTFDIATIVLTRLDGVPYHWKLPEPEVFDAPPIQRSPIPQKEAERVEYVLDELRRLVMDTVGVGTWREDGGQAGSVSVFGTTLIVTNTPEVQKQVADMLNAMEEHGLARVRNREEIIRRLKAANGGR